MRSSTLALVAAGLANASTLTPPVLPLIVRNPYLSAWLGDARHAPWESWPIFWTGDHVGFAAMASVPHTNKFYPLLGRPQDSISHSTRRSQLAYPDYLGTTFDASTTNLTYLIPGSDELDESAAARLTLSFLSPITPSSTMRQSFPAAYLTVSVEGPFDLDFYLDLNGQWVSGNRGNHITWSLEQQQQLSTHAAAAADARTITKTTPIKTWKVARTSEQLYTEFADHAEWGTLYFSAPHHVAHQAGTSSILRQQFSQHGTLRNTVDQSFRSIMDEEPAFAFSKAFKLGSGGASSSSSSHDSVIFTIALVQDPVIQFASARGLTHMRPLWASYFATAQDLIRYHYNDFATAARLAHAYSTTLARDAFASGAHDYVDIAALSARQVLGATQFAGTPGAPVIFLKEISSDGNLQTVDVIYPAFPFFLYTNPRWLAYLLEPLLEHQLSSQYPNDYSMHDLGSHFPNATGHPDGRDEYMPVEECGNMLIMGLALVHAMQDAGSSSSSEPSSFAGHAAAAKWVRRSYPLWKQWTGYLIRESLIPANQLCTDDFAGWLANQTNLALKGIIGVRAMADLAAVAGRDDEAREYQQIADEYMGKWMAYGISRDGTHAKLAYTWFGSWTTVYNLFADALLCFHLPEDEGDKKKHFIPNQVYAMQSDWYAAVLQRYGLPLDSRHLYTKSDWEFFAAAVTSSSTRVAILDRIAVWVNETTTDRPLTDLYETEGTGGFPGPHFMARPVVGGHFAFLALERACGGKAVEGLRFLDERTPAVVNVYDALEKDMRDSEAERPLRGDGEL